MFNYMLARLLLFGLYGLRQITTKESLGVGKNTLHRAVLWRLHGFLVRFVLYIVRCCYSFLTNTGINVFNPLTPTVAIWVQL